MYNYNNLTATIIITIETNDYDDTIQTSKVFLQSVYCCFTSIAYALYSY